MKKSFLFLLIFCFCFINLYGCKNSKFLDLVAKNIAEERINIFNGETSNLFVTLMSGYREENYIINGYCTPKMPFGVLTVKINNDNLLTTNNIGKFFVEFGSTKLEGSFEKNPYDGTYVADIKSLIIVNKVDVKIIFGSFNESLTLNNVSDGWTIKSFDALKIAVDIFQKELKSFVKNNEFLGECYIKIRFDEKISKDEFFWLVHFVSISKKSLSVIIEPNTGKMLAKKINIK